MHKDVIKVKGIKKPTGDILCVYYSSLTENTHTFVTEKLKLNSIRIPYEKKLVNKDDKPVEGTIRVDKDYVLFCPTFCGGGEFTEGAVPKEVIKFLNVKENRDHCRGVIASGNTNFNETFALSGPILSKKLNVPLLYQYELRGTQKDVENVKDILNKFWGK
ncbi:class Ib ribonucleoside-diphosphate reductase assembly flavoprotein NrdI [Mycoplasma elephantis]|uniref:class Ib ribonucleoside-diphosphate reductase assembly flavoprotein NrdI n=1 Tax=Mycoplasma elephantis TaxID=114882 RepID=UPI00048A2F30|nr:class Ib ribonucleoside-diphosphate reductase assembly flavoprotein NrdI [Mycoplasma elephantis]